MVPSLEEPLYTLPLDFISEIHVTFAASNFDTTSELALQIVGGVQQNLHTMKQTTQQNRTTMSTTLALVAAKALPALSGSSLTYNPEKNVYLTLGYTSAAGNTYYKAIRFSERLAVYYHIGEGYAHTFLNGITLFAWNGQKANIIAQKFWGGCNWRCFNERTAKEESILMLKDFLAGQAKAMGSVIAESQLLAFSRNMIEETQQKLLQ